MDDLVTVDVYFDFSCPYVYGAACWLQEVEKQLGSGRIAVNWKFFPLEQVNAPEDAEFSVWELPADRRSRSRDSLHAAEAARRQGSEAFRLFHAALLGLKHEQEHDHGKRATLEEAAKLADLDLGQFNDDLADRGLLQAIRDDYRQGREDHGVFGTPTFVFANGQAAYLQVFPPPPAEDAVPLWNDFVRSVRDRPYLREIKRPKRAP